MPSPFGYQDESYPLFFCKANRKNIIFQVMSIRKTNVPLYSKKL